MSTLSLNIWILASGTLPAHHCTMLTSSAVLHAKKCKNLHSVHVIDPWLTRWLGICTHFLRFYALVSSAHTEDYWWGIDTWSSSYFHCCLFYTMPSSFLNKKRTSFKYIVYFCKLLVKYWLPLLFCEGHLKCRYDHRDDPFLYLQQAKVRV
jgi:hypothetical protein